MESSMTPKYTQEQLVEMRNCREQTLADYIHKKRSIFYIVKNKDSDLRISNDKQEGKTI